MNEQEYRNIFPDSELRADSQAAGRWETNHGGEYFAAGVGGSITGRGADLLIIDDPHSEQDAMSKTSMEMHGTGIPLVLDSVYNQVVRQLWS